jgi:hypothetical protein
MIVTTLKDLPNLVANTYHSTKYSRLLSPYLLYSTDVDFSETVHTV